SNSYRRKPNPGMLLEAIEQLNINPDRSWMVGDSESDIIAGKRAGVRTIFLNPSPPVQSVANRQYVSLNDINEEL
ncbi:MAG: HAD-IA family hydrolase, partial [Ignavibacteria bacterium]|nr:HAD-IA family hydrolase [Ignavibacteria bacterium]